MLKSEKAGEGHVEFEESDSGKHKCTFGTWARP